MHGNVSELCADVYESNFYLHCSAENPVQDQEGKFWVVRGGGWVNLPQHCRSSYRSYVHPENRYEYLGVRLAMVKKDGPRPK